MRDQRCPDCDEPKFMCECNRLHKEFQGELVTDVYHKGCFVGGKQKVLGTYYLPFKPTVIINKRGKMLVSPHRHDPVVHQMMGV